MTVSEMVLPIKRFCRSFHIVIHHCDTVANTYKFPHTCLLCALHRGCMGHVECVVNIRIVTSSGLLDEIRQLQNRLKV